MKRGVTKNVAWARDLPDRSWKITWERTGLSQGISAVTVNAAFEAFAECHPECEGDTLVGSCQGETHRLVGDWIFPL